MVQHTAVHQVQEIKVILHITRQTLVLFNRSGVQSSGSVSYFGLKITWLLWFNIVVIKLEAIGDQNIICICAKKLLK